MVIFNGAKFKSEIGVYGGLSMTQGIEIGLEVGFEIEQARFVFSEPEPKRFMRVFYLKEFEHGIYFLTCVKNRIIPIEKPWRACALIRAAENGLFLCFVFLLR